MSDPAILILAAGQSRRMRGRDKLMEPVGGMPLIRRQAEMARRVTRGAVIVALPVPPHPRHDALDGLDVIRLPVSDAAEGMGASLRAGFAAMPPGAEVAMVLLGDMPDLTDSDLHTMLDAVEADSGDLVWHATTQDGQRGHPVVFAAALFPAFARLGGDAGARDVVKTAGKRVKHVPLPGQHARTDLDTPEDWAAWRAAQG